MQDDDKIQAHGKTYKEMRDLQHAQMHKNVVRVAANNAAQIADKHFSGYLGHEIDEHEQHLYHMVQEGRLFDQQSGERISKENVQKYTPEAYEFMKKNNGFAGMVTHILHNPKLGQPEKVVATPAKTASGLGTTSGTEVKSGEAKIEETVDETDKPDEVEVEETVVPEPTPLSFKDIGEARRAFHQMTGEKADKQLSLEDITDQLNALGVKK